MKTNFLNSENEWDELVFENRNKNYGAYVLRSEYDLTVFKSYLFTIGSLLIFSLAFYILGRKQHILPQVTDPTLEPIICILPPPVTLPPPTHNPPVNPGTGQTTARSFIIDSVDRQPINEPSITTQTSTTTTTASTAGQGATQGTENGGVNTGTGSTLPEGGSLNNPAAYAEVPPEFPGGDAALEAFIRNRVNFYRARNAGIEKARIIISFVISPDGSVMNIEAVSSKGFGMEEAVMDAVSKMPKWNPGKIKNTNVYVKLFLPVEYELN